MAFDSGKPNPVSNAGLASMIIPLSISVMATASGMARKVRENFSSDSRNACSMRNRCMVVMMMSAQARSRAICRSSQVCPGAVRPMTMPPTTSDPSTSGTANADPMLNNSRMRRVSSAKPGRARRSDMMPVSAGFSLRARGRKLSTGRSCTVSRAGAKAGAHISWEMPKRCSSAESSTTAARSARRYSASCCNACSIPGSRRLAGVRNRLLAILPTSDSNCRRPLISICMRCRSIEVAKDRRPSAGALRRRHPTALASGFDPARRNRGFGHREAWEQTLRRRAPHLRASDDRPLLPLANH